MKIVVVIATGMLVTATLLPLWRHPHWLVRGMDFSRLQLATAALLLILIQVISLNLVQAQAWAFISNTLVCLAWQLCTCLLSPGDALMPDDPRSRSVPGILGQIWGAGHNYFRYGSELEVLSRDLSFIRSALLGHRSSSPVIRFT